MVETHVKIVDITEFHSERGGGIRSHLETRGRLLGSWGHDHVVIAAGPVDRVEAPSAGTPSRTVRIAGRAHPYDSTYYLLARLDKVAARVRAERPDVVEAHSPYLAAAGAVVAGRGSARVRTAFWHSDHVAAYVEPAVRRALGASAARAFAASLRRAARVLLGPFDATFVAGRGQACMLRSVGIPNVVHVPFGADAAAFHPRAGTAADRQRLLGDRPSAALLVGAGRFAFEKRWDVVLDAFARVRARRDAVLVLFGDGPERARLEARAPRGVRFEGFVRDRRRLAAALSQADVLVHGCPCETSGLGIIEAVACGLPVVVPDEGGAAESIDPACSATYRSGDAAACAAAVQRLLDRDPGELRARALAAAARTTTAEQHVRAVEGVYDDLLRRR